MSRSRAFNVTLQTIWLLLASTMLTSCVSVKLVSNYDQNIDDGVSALQKKSERFLIDFKEYSPESEAFYKEVRVEISSLRVRADSLQRNSLTVRMLDQLQKNFDRLEHDHKEGITKAEIPLYRGGLNSQFTSILSFELAKKRGDKPDEDTSLAPPTKTSGN